jgi:hypothetical protein
MSLLNEGQVMLGVKEELGDGKGCPSLLLAKQGLDIVIERMRLRVPVGECRNSNALKGLWRVRELAHQGDQVDRVVQLAVVLECSVWQVASKGEEVGNALRQETDH